MNSGLSSKKDVIVQMTYSMKALSNAKQFLSLTFFKMSTKRRVLTFQVPSCWELESVVKWSAVYSPCV